MLNDMLERSTCTRNALFSTAWRAAVEGRPAATGRSSVVGRGTELEAADRHAPPRAAALDGLQEDPARPVRHRPHGPARPVPGLRELSEVVVAREVVGADGQAGRGRG